MNGDFMGWADDHLKAVAHRWRDKREKSSLSAAEFEDFTRKTMKENGWSESETNRIVRIVMRGQKKDAEAKNMIKQRQEVRVKRKVTNEPQVWNTKKQAESAKHNGEALGYEVELKKVTIKKKDKKPHKEKKPLRPDPFAHADDVYVTKNKIAVTTITKKSAKRGYTKTTQTKYYVQSAANLRKLKAARGGTVRVGRTGNKYRNI